MYTDINVVNEKPIDCLILSFYPKSRFNDLEFDNVLLISQKYLSLEILTVRTWRNVTRTSKFPVMVKKQRHAQIKPNVIVYVNSDTAGSRKWYFCSSLSARKFVDEKFAILKRRSSFVMRSSWCIDSWAREVICWISFIDLVKWTNEWISSCSMNEN